MENSIVLHGFGLTKIYPNWNKRALPRFMADKLYFVISGEAECTIHDKTYRLTANHMYLIPATNNLRFGYIPDTPMNHIYFDFVSPTYKLYNDIIDVDMTLEENILYKKYYEYIKLFFEKSRITNANFLSNANSIAMFREYSSVIHHHLSCILYSINKTYNLNFTTNPVVSKAISYIHENFEKPITVKELAAASYIDESYFIKIFKKHMHQTPYRFIKAYRLNNALKMLELNMPIHEIAAKTGYDSNASFSKSFRKEFGTSPSSFYKKKDK